MVKQELNNPALLLLNEALVRYPDDVRLLYNRATLWAKLDELLKMETDLRRLLNMQPGNSYALIPLLDSITNQTQDDNQADDPVAREAFKPEDPATLDSVGWALHNSGELETALNYLKKAYAMLPDPEIAAHLGTVYWKLGKTHLAKQVWANSLKKHPSYDLLNKLSAITDDNF